MFTKFGLTIELDYLAGGDDVTFMQVLEEEATSAREIERLKRKA